MLTTTLDGLWVLQAVTGIETLCPELGLRPLLPRLDTADRAVQHPIAEELTEIGALDGQGEADPMIREWLTVIMRRDVATKGYFLGKASAIVDELMTPLAQANDEPSLNIVKLYRFARKRMSDAHVKNDRKALAEAKRILLRLESMFEELIAR